MDEISNFYEEEPKLKKSIYLIFIVIIISLLYYSTKNYTYDIKEILFINECNENECLLKTTLDYEEQKIINNKTIFVYKNKEYNVDNIEYEEPYLSNETPVTDITIKTDIKTDEKIIKVKVKYNKQRIIKKIKENLIERN